MTEIEVTLPTGQRVNLDAEATQIVVKSKVSLADYMNGKRVKMDKKLSRSKFTANDIRAMKQLKTENPKKTLKQLSEMSGYSDTAIGRALRGEYNFLLERETA